MPPHCDSLDGPVVKAARNALDSKNVDFALPFVPLSAEPEVRAAFDKVMAVRGSGTEARALSEHWFCETLVRLHLGGEGKPFRGLRPAGQHPPIIGLADESVNAEDARPVAAALTEALETSLEERFARVMRLKKHDPTDIFAARTYTSAMLAYVVWVLHTFAAIMSHEHETTATHEPRSNRGIERVIEG